MPDESDEFLASREFLINNLLPYCDWNSNWGQIYKSLKDKQLHFSCPQSFGKRSNDSYVATCTELCNKHSGFAITTHPMISIGLQHKDALYIIRKLAGHFERDVTCQCLSSGETEFEEGEIVDYVLDLIESYTSNAFLFDLCIYDCVRFHVRVSTNT